MTTMEHHGSTGGNNVQVQIDLSDKAPEPLEPPSSFAPWIVGFVFVTVVLFLIVKVVSFLGDVGKEEAFPKHSDRWPVGSTPSAVLAPVVAKLQSCAAEKVPEPENCPQRVSDAVMERATWTLEGDPAAGARLAYRKGRFDIIGHAIMTATYDSYTGQKFSLQRVVYRAKVNWSNGHPVLDGELHATKAKPDAPIVKNVTGQAWSQVQASLIQAFTRCEQSPAAPMRAGCPRDAQTDVSANHARWHFDSDPLQNTRSTVDRSWGLIHVVGNYAVTLRTGGWVPLTEHGGGAYDAVLAVDGTGWPRVLRIEHR